MTLVKEAISAVIDENGNFNFEKDKLTYFKEIKTYSIDKLDKEVQKYNLSNDERVGKLNKYEKIQYIKCLLSDTFVYTDNGTISNEARKKLLISLNKVFIKTLEKELNFKRNIDIVIFKSLDVYKSKKQKNRF